MVADAWTKLQNAIPGAFVGILKRHLEETYDSVARTTVGRRFASLLAGMGPVGRSITEASLNLLGVVAAEAIPGNSPWGGAAQDVAKDFTPEMFSRFINGLHTMSE